MPWRQRWSQRLLTLPDGLLAMVAGSATAPRDGARLEPALRVLCRVSSARGRLHLLAPSEARRRLAALDELIPKAVTLMDRIEHRVIPGAAGEMTIRIYTPADLRAHPPALVYFHGGGWVLGDLELSDAFCRMIAGQTPCKVISVDYRLAPEHPFPAAVEDAVVAYRWTVENAEALRIDGRRIAVGGDSAGGNLAAIVSATCRLDGGAAADRPAAQVLLYPVTSARRDTPSYERFARGYGLERDTMDYFFEHYLAGAGGEDPLISPLHAEDFSALPPSIVATAGCDVLRDEGDLYAAKLAEAGVEVAHLRYPSLMHSFANMSGLPAPRRALDQIISELAAVFHRLA